MRTVRVLLLATSLCYAGFSWQQTTPPNPHGNPQDVPKQKPGTDSPDLGKGQTPAPRNGSSKNKDDVPQQEPGTENPDVAKDKRSEKPDSSSGTDQTGKSKKKTKGKTQTSS